MIRCKLCHEVQFEGVVICEDCEKKYKEMLTTISGVINDNGLVSGKIISVTKSEEALK